MFLHISFIRAIDFNIVLCQQLLTMKTQGGLPVVLIILFTVYFICPQNK